MKPLPLTDAERIYLENSKYGPSATLLIRLPSGRMGVMNFDSERRPQGAFPPTMPIGEAEWDPIPTHRQERPSVASGLTPVRDPSLSITINLDEDL